MSQTSKTSGNIAEELREYATSREEDMRKRVAEYRELKEKELKQVLTEKIRDHELKRVLVERMRNGDQSQIQLLHDLDVITRRVQRETQRIAREGQKASRVHDVLVDKLRMQVASDLESKLGEVRFSRECEILADCKHTRDVVDRVREAALNLSLTSSCVFEATSASIERLGQSFTRRKADLSRAEHSIRDSTERELQGVVQSGLDSLSLDIHDFLNDLKRTHRVSRDQLASQRRRLQLTIAKRIQDLAWGQEEARASAVHDVVSEYKAELSNLLVRYFDSQLAQKSFSAAQAGDPAASIMDPIANVPTKEQIKFVQTIFERFGCEELITACARRMKMGLNDSVSFRS